jgi:hypothetical protein
VVEDPRATRLKVRPEVADLKVRLVAPHQAAVADQAMETRAAEIPARETRAAEIPARETRATGTPAMETRATGTPAMETRATGIPARGSNRAEVGVEGPRKNFSTSRSFDLLTRSHALRNGSFRGMLRNPVRFWCGGYCTMR